MANASSTLRSNDDFYSFLGVSPLANISVIREAYKKLALRYHPDKNRTATATADFQRLVVAWETLSDDSRRADYDRSYVRGKRKHSDTEDGTEEAARARRRKEDMDREQTSWWRRNSATSETFTNPTSGFEAGPEHESYFQSFEYRHRVRAWKASTARTYASRLQAWNLSQRMHMAQIRNYRLILQKHTLELLTQTSEPKSSVVQKFQAAIARYSSPHREDPDVVLAKLMAARELYIEKLHQTIASVETTLADLQRELEAARAKYEDDEADDRHERIADALAFLGPRALNPPLLSALDWRGRAINSWNALAGVKRGVCFSYGVPDIASAAASASVAPDERDSEPPVNPETAICETPWHQAGEWERSVGEYACGRCGQAAFHVIPECGSAKCPGCGMVVCNACHRNLQLLREYEAWLMEVPPPARTPGPYPPLATPPKHHARASMFELEFEVKARRERPRSSPSPSAQWAGNKGKGSWEWHFGNMGMNSSL